MMRPSAFFYGLMSKFDARVHAQLIRIPPGCVMTYGDLARSVGRPNAARAVAQACARNPHPVVVPCHRVVMSDGRVGGYSGPGGIARKIALLRSEGVQVWRGRIGAFPSRRFQIETVEKR